MVYCLWEDLATKLLSNFTEGLTPGNTFNFYSRAEKKYNAYKNKLMVILDLDMKAYFSFKTILEQIKSSFNRKC